MTANIINAKEGKNVSKNRKEKGFYASYVGVAASYFTNPETNTTSKVLSMTEFMDVRLYMPGRDGASPQYCCVWGRSPAMSTYFSGGGKAQGYGYHKASAAMQAALDDAGVTLDQNIDGVGDLAMQEAIIAVGKAMGYQNIIVVRSHA